MVSVVSLCPFNDCCTGKRARERMALFSSFISVVTTNERVYIYIYIDEVFSQFVVVVVILFL